MKAFARCIAVATFLLAGAVNVYADVYGSISGAVRDNSGSALPGVTVNVTGAVLPKGRDTVTDSSGNYSFLKLPPGTYTVNATLAGMGNARGNATVVVDQNTTLNLKVSPTVSETLTVTAGAPIVDMKKTEVNFNYDAKMIERLPLSRTYQGLFQLAPGIAENNSFSPVAGGGRQENYFLLDGVSVTNPLFGYPSLLTSDANELDIQDFNIKRAAFSADTGRPGGMVINAVTKSGTNQLAGAVREEWIPGSWAAKAKDSSFQANTTRSRTAANIGGPIWRDHVFGYASGRYERATVSKRTNFAGAVPDQTVSVKELFGKLTATPTSSQFIALGYRRIPQDQPLEGISTYTLPERAEDEKHTNTVATLDYNWSASNSTLVEAKLLRTGEASSYDARTNLGFKPAFDPKNLRRMGAVTIPDPAGSGVQVAAGGYYVRHSNQDYKHNQVKAAVTQFFDFGGMNHQVKAGGGYEYGEENLLRLSNGWGTISDIGNNRLRARYYPDQPPLLSFGKTYSAYVQDSITVTPRLNVNLGVLANRDSYGQEKGDRKITFLTFGFGKQLQPRIGVNYNLRANAGDKVYVNFARYSLMEQKNTARGLGPLGLIQSRAIFDATTGALISDRPSSADTGNAEVLPGTKPTYAQEYLLGYATPLGGLWSIDAFGMYRDTKHFIEDYPLTMPDEDFVAGNLVNAKRKYYGVTFDLQRRLANRWSADVNYTWSRLYGNAEWDYAGGIYTTASYLQDGPGRMVEEPNRWGALVQNRTHVFKAFGSYEVIPNLNLGGYFRYQSGAPWQAMGRDHPCGCFGKYLEPAGSHRTPSWSNFDVSASYGFPLRGSTRLYFEARVLNFFDKQTVLTVDAVPYLDPPIYLDADPWIRQGTTKPNPNYMKPTSYASPRRFIAMVRLDF
jgi:hypothetical protein